MPGFHTPYHLEVSGGKVGLLVYIKKSLSITPVKKYTLPKDSQAVYFEINLRKE